MIPAELAGELRAVMARGVGEPLPEETFNALALRVFAYQCETNPAYAGFVARRGVDPNAVGHWREVPFLPARAFKNEVLVSGDAALAERVFRTSGTSTGLERRGEHHVLDLSLYRASLLPNFMANVTGGNDPRTVLSLLPSPEDATDSSLSFMIGEIVDRLGTAASGYFVDGEGDVDVAGLRRALQVAADREDPLLVTGTAFSFVRFLEAAWEDHWTVTLPTGTVLLETGGYKGRSTALDRADFYRGLEEVLGVRAPKIVNEYGMTELLSQFYEPVLSEPDGEGVTLDARFHRGPPWVRTVLLHPLTLEAVPEGEEGVLAHFDLANVGSVAPVLTEDLGLKVKSGFRLLGRNPGSEPRGCSLAMEDFLASRRQGQ